MFFNKQKYRINSLVALWMATKTKGELAKKIKYKDIPFLGVTIFEAMVPMVENEDGISTKDYDAKVSIHDLLMRIDP